MNEYNYQERHMGTEVSLSFVCEEQSVAETFAARAFSTIHDYEKRFSRFLAESELSQLNERGSLVVSADFLDVLTKSIELFNLTKGAFNPLVQVNTLGYTKSFAALKNTQAILSPTSYNTNLEKISIDPKTNTVTLQPNQQLDFGGILKGYLATKLADEIKVSCPARTGIIINIGGDIATRGFDALHEPFIFELYNPITGEEIGTALTDTSLATSGTYARRWQTNSGMRHHIVDGAKHANPKNNLVATSIVHADGAVAESLTKLFLVAGVDAALARAPSKKHNYKYFSVFADGTIATNLV